MLSLKSFSLKYLVSIIFIYLTSYTLHAEEWSIGMFSGSSPFSLSEDGIQNPVLTKEDVSDVPADFVADPFIFLDNGVYHMFMEVLNRNTSQGDIAYATSVNGIDWQYQQIVLDEPFHLSYPLVFRDNGKIYMIPESHNANSVRLYEATNFPTEWTFISELLTGDQLVDNTVFFHNNIWWMFSSTSDNATMYLHYASNIEGPWTSHPQNPIIQNDGNTARPGGRILQYGGVFYRMAQDDLPTYGESVRVFQITDISTTSYSEVEISESPILEALGSGWRSAGMHQVDHIETTPGQWLAVTDGYGFPNIDYIPPPPPPPVGQLLSKVGWSLHSTDSEEVNGEDGRAINAFDDDLATIWHTEWSNNSPSHPHNIQINLGGTYDVTGIRYTPRQDGGLNGRVGNYEIYVSFDGVTWGAPVSSGTLNNVSNPQDISFATKAAQYVRFVSLDDPSGTVFTAVAEIDVYGNTFTGNLPPESFIDTPITNINILQGEFVDFAGSGLDPEADYPLSYNWIFDSASGLSNFSLQNPGLLQFNNLGTFTVSMSVTDSIGKTDSSPASVTVTVADGSVPVTLDKSQWTLHYVDSQETNGEDGAAINAFDDDTSSFWHTEWSNNSPTHPHDIQINLGGSYDLNGFEFMPRQDGGQNGRVGAYEIYTSMDGLGWGSPVSTGTFINNSNLQMVTFPATAGQFIRLRSLSDPSGTAYTAIAEIGVYGDSFSGNLPPDSVITTPVDDITIIAGNELRFTGSGLDFENDSPLLYEWNFGDGSGIADSSLQNPGLLMFNTPGIFQVSLTVSDSFGNTDTSPATITVTVLDPSAPILLDKSTWNLLYVDSEEVSGEDGAASNAFDGDLSTIWHTAWQNSEPNPPHEIQIDLGLPTTLTGLRYWPRQDGGTNGRIGSYEIYISSDGVNWANASATGVFNNTASPQEVNLNDTTGQYIRIRVLTESNGNPWTAVAEFDVFARP